MIRALVIILLLFLSVSLGLYLSHDPGYVLVSVHHWTIETSLLIALAVFFIAFFLLHIIWGALRWVVRMPSRWRHWRQKRRMQKAQARTRQGLIEFSEGYWQQAKKHLINALPNTDTPLINYLIAARAAQELGESKLRDNYLREAQQSMPDAKIAVELTQAQLQLANKQWEQALATLKHLHSLAPHHPHVLKLLLDLYQEVRDWTSLIDLLPEIRHNQVIDKEAFNRLQQYVYLQAMNDLIKQEQYRSVHDFVENIPYHLRSNPEIIARYSQYLIDNNHDKQAETILKKGLKKHFNDELLNLYGRINADIVSLSFIESLLKEHPHNATLFLTLGRICKSKTLWGKARQYLEKSIELTPSPEAYAELGTVLQALQEDTEAFEAYRKGLLLATDKKYTEAVHNWS